MISNKFITFAKVKYSELFRLLKKDGWFEIRQSGNHEASNQTGTDYRPLSCWQRS